MNGKQSRRSNKKRTLPVTALTRDLILPQSKSRTSIFEEQVLPAWRLRQSITFVGVLTDLIVSYWRIVNSVCEWISVGDILRDIETHHICSVRTIISDDRVI